jgi:hypothetical protein
MDRSCSIHEKMRNAYRISVENLKWRDQLGELGGCRKITVKSIFEE